MAAKQQGSTIPDPNEKIRYADNGVFGQAIYMGRRTAAHLDWTKARLAAKHPGARLVIIQGAYNTGIDASAGTHDFDACLDVQIIGLDWWANQRFLRECGWAAWYRYPPTFPNHVHMISLGYGDAPVGIYIPGQVVDYHEHKTGLVGHAYDPTWHPVDINATVFSYPDYIRSQEDDMPTVQDLLDAKINSDADVRAALRAAVRTDANVGRLLNLLPKINGGFRDIHKALDDLSNQAKNDATKQAVANVRSRVALAEQTIVEQLGGIGKEDNA
jgi:hypothetical protein